MFGFITPYKPDMRMREWTLYKAYYCGLCHTIKADYGQLPRLALNYDFVTLAMLADSINDSLPAMKASRCVASPVQKKCYCINSVGLKIAAACQILATHYKLYDNAIDEHGAKAFAARAAMLALRKAHKRAAEAFPCADLTLKSQTALQARLEKGACSNADMAAEPTAQMTACVFSLCATNEANKKLLFRLGLMLGKIIYFLDAAEDYNEDIENHKYNVFSSLSHEQAIQKATELCRLCAGEAALSYNLLELNSNKEILDNIVFLGIEQSILNAGKKRRREKPTDR